MSEGPGERPNHTGRSVITWLFYLALGTFLVFYLRDLDWATITDLDPEPVVLLLALPFSLAARLLQPLAWGQLIRDYGESPPSYPHLSHVYAKSWLGRYIPGKIAWLGAKVFFGSRYRISKGVLGVTSVIEGGIQLLTALGVSFLLFAVSGRAVVLPEPLRILSVVAFVAMMISLFPPVFNTVVRKAHQLLRGRGLRSELRFSTAGLGRATTTYLVIQTVGTAVPFLVLKAIYPEVTLAHLPYVAAATIFSGALGTLALFAPSGLGVREGILIVLLVAVVPREIALVAVLVMRLWSVAADFLFYLVTAAFARVAAP